MAEADVNQGDGRILEDYLSELRAIRATGGGVAETSYYPALSNLFNAAGGGLKPKVRCVMNLRNLGDGMPDGGLFTADQFQRQADDLTRAADPESEPHSLLNENSLAAHFLLVGAIGNQCYAGP